MSEDNETKKPTWFSREYPIEWYFTDLLAGKLFEVLGKMPEHTLLEFTNRPNFLDIKQSTEPDGSIKRDVNINASFLMLCGLVSKIIFDTINDLQIKTSDIWTEGLSQKVNEKITLDYPDTKTFFIKKCANLECGAENSINAKYCNQCASPFD